MPGSSPTMARRCPVMRLNDVGPAHDDHCGEGLGHVFFMIAAVGRLAAGYAWAFERCGSTFFCRTKPISRKSFILMASRAVSRHV